MHTRLAKPTIGPISQYIFLCDQESSVVADPELAPWMDPAPLRIGPSPWTSGRRAPLTLEMATRQAVAKERRMPTMKWATFLSVMTVL